MYYYYLPDRFTRCSGGMYCRCGAGRFTFLHGVQTSGVPCENTPDPPRWRLVCARFVLQNCLLFDYILTVDSWFS